jgi:hypothetical protein
MLEHTKKPHAKIILHFEDPVEKKNVQKNCSICITCHIVFYY